MKRDLELQLDIIKIIRKYYKLLYDNKCDNFRGNKKIPRKIKLTKPKSSRRNRKSE